MRHERSGWDRSFFLPEAKALISSHLKFILLRNLLSEETQFLHIQHIIQTLVGSFNFRLRISDVVGYLSNIHISHNQSMRDVR